jgi:hypothetical protein
MRAALALTSPTRGWTPMDHESGDGNNQVPAPNIVIPARSMGSRRQRSHREGVPIIIDLSLEDMDTPTATTVSKLSASIRHT